ncbi:MAG TPA: hypothetical protein PKZ53_25990, partial [Acidobacteriota bacterium]|nr:hypothetical protein [Acidobacteriota bacterium]
YENGKTGTPYLVFPGVSDVGENDSGKAGKLLFFPSRQDCFQIEQMGDGSLVKTGEEIVFILSPKRLAELPPLPDDQPRAVDTSLFGKWVSSWSAPTWQFENQSTVGNTLTLIEKSAELTNSAVLTTDAPLPQSVFHVKSIPGQPILFRLPLKIRKR